MEAKRKVDGDALEQCLADGCEATPRIKGLCNPCYQSALAGVRNKTSSWEELERLGLVWPRKRGKFSAALQVRRDQAIASGESGNDSTSSNK